MAATQREHDFSPPVVPLPPLSQAQVAACFSPTPTPSPVWGQALTLLLFSAPLSSGAPGNHEYHSQKLATMFLSSRPKPHPMMSPRAPLGLRPSPQGQGLRLEGRAAQRTPSAQRPQLLPKQASSARPRAQARPTLLPLFLWVTKYLGCREDQPDHLARGQGPQGHLQLLLRGILQGG